MGLVIKRSCDICGGKLDLIGSHKASDGSVCGECADKLSPFFFGMRNTSVKQIRQQLAYREQNSKRLKDFAPTSVMGFDTKVYFDADRNYFIVSRSSDYRAENADVIGVSLVKSAVMDIKEHKTEIFRKDSRGYNRSYLPKKYEYSYEMIVNIHVDSPFFDKIEFEITKDRPDSKDSPEYARYKAEAEMIVEALTKRSSGSTDNDGAGCYAKQGFNNDPGCALPGAITENQAFGGKWVCTVCGTENIETVCRICGAAKYLND